MKRYNVIYKDQRGENKSVYNLSTKETLDLLWMSKFLDIRNYYPFFVEEYK